jgi:trehalose 6-phosphate synthase
VRSLRYLLPLLASFAVLAWAATELLSRTQRRWFERDVAHRAELAVVGARARLAQAWRDGERRSAARLLEEIAVDGRILAAAACREGVAFATSAGREAKRACDAVGSLAPDAIWSGVLPLRGEDIHATAVPLADLEGALGHVVVLQEVAFIRAREESTRRFSLGIFAAVAALASVVTVLSARFSWRSWTRELRRLLAGGGRRGGGRLAPILGDVKDLASQLAAEQLAGAGTAWSPERLRQTLTRHLNGESAIVLANREPYVHERGPDGQIRVIHPASGLVTALEPVMRACSGTWVAHGGGSADRETVDSKGRLRVPPGDEKYVLRRVWLSPEEERGYYYGFANEGLWPLCHVAHVRPVFRSEDFEHYARVNRRFADAVCEEAVQDDPVVLVQDYHYALAPRAIRRRLPRATILTFWHIPWVNPERLGICPHVPELLDGLLGSSILGFQTQLHCNLFLDAVDAFLEARIDRERQSVVLGGHETLVRAYPISIEWPSQWAAAAPPVAECRREVRAALGLAPDALLGVGVDRMDYTKGIEDRLLAVERLLERQPRFRGRFTFAQLAAPSRTAIPAYRDMDRRVEEIVQRVNQRFGTPKYRPIVLRRAHHEPPEVFRHYRAADLTYVSSLHDGMNLVAKEFVASREDERGVLVLSKFTGAARDLPEALLVNPYDLDEAAGALAAALEMPGEEQAERMRAMRTFLSHFNVYRWAGRMLIDAAALRRRDRLADRIVEGARLAEGGAA